jgi:hypothetical protein
MRQIARFLLVLVLSSASLSAQAACPNAVAVVPLIENGPAIHVSVHDQNCTQITVGSPSQFGISPAGLSNCSPAQVAMSTATPLPTKIVGTADATGVSFQGVVGATGMAACTIAVEFHDGSLVQSAQLSLSLSSGVTAVNLESP